jgi:LacI family transcriptional regulator
MAVTMKQIAADVGVSIVTVSKVLHNNTDVSKKTRDLVLQRARELGYRPNLTARSLVTGRSSLVGLLVPDLVHSFFSEVARSLSAALREQGLYLLICSSEGDTRLEQEQLEHLLSRGLDAIVVAPVGDDDLALKMVSESGTPLILLDRQAPLIKSHFVGVNDLLVGTLATEHLIQIGCRNIAHLRGPENSVGEKRLEGYKRALKTAGFAYRPELVSEISRGDVVSKTQGADAMKQFLSKRQRPDGLFCFSDSMAIGAMDAAIELGVSIPKELAVVGCGNLHYDSSLRVPLSSIDQKSERIGQRAAGIVLENVMRNKYDELPKENGALANIVLKPELVIRQSSMRRG